MTVGTTEGSETPSPEKAADGAPTFVTGRVGVVGLGLIGGSFAKAMAAGGRSVYASDRTQSVIDLARVETIDGELDDETVGTCEIVILACYPQACVDWLAANADRLSPGAIVMDASGVKRAVCEQCFAIAAKHPFTFVGGHPMAGTQFSGFGHAKATLFRGAPLVLVIDESDDFARLELLERLKALLAPCGFGQWTLTTAERHDELIAYTSQLAHVVSNAYVKSPTAQLHHGFSAGSYRDLTRVARLNPTMWTELFLDNADNLSRELGFLIGSLSEYKDAIDARDATRLQALLTQGDRLKRAAEASDGKQGQR